MAPTNKYLPRPKLVAFALVIVAIYAIMTIAGTWTPRLGLDLRGGTTVTLTAREIQDSGSQVPAPSATASTPAEGEGESESTPAPDQAKAEQNWTEAMEQAASIIQQRVDSLGVGEATVTVSGTNQIEIAVPNIADTDLVDLVGQTASLAFRVVYTYDLGAVLPTATPTPTEDGEETPEATPSATVSPGEASAASTESPEPPSATESTTPQAPASSAPGRLIPQLPTAPTTPRPTVAGETGDNSFETLLAWTPTDQDLSDFTNFMCGDSFPDVWDQPLIACGDKDEKTGAQYKYLLGPAILQGERITDATAGIPQGQLSWIVSMSFDALGQEQFSKATAYLATKTIPQNQFAIVLDSTVVSAPSVSEAITGGSAQISGTGINQNTAQTLARQLRYGALPLAFDVSSVDTVSASLGGEQLRAGLIAGVIGLILVLIYCVIYYRALSLIIFGSLAATAAITYGIIVLLGESIGFALNLPGVAGAILAIGVTADSFIVYFERIRDEVHDGFSLQHSIESGWNKAIGTILVADSVQLLSAVVLFFLAIGAVKGFAFTLLVTTLIDVFVVFFFTKPWMSILGRIEFFSSGHKWSGFDPEHLGVTVEQIRGARRASLSSKDLDESKEV